MLIINRRPGESTFFIQDGEIIGEVSVMGVKGYNTRLGFNFGGDVDIFRGDLMLKMGHDYIGMMADWEERKQADEGFD